MDSSFPGYSDFLMLGIILIGSALTVFYRDVRYVVPLGIQLWFYATPIIYPITLVEENMPQFRTLYALTQWLALCNRTGM